MRRWRWRRGKRRRRRRRGGLAKHHEPVAVGRHHDVRPAVPANVAEREALRVVVARVRHAEQCLDAECPVRPLEVEPRLLPATVQRHDVGSAVLVHVERLDGLRDVVGRVHDRRVERPGGVLREDVEERAGPVAADRQHRILPSVAGHVRNLEALPVRVVVDGRLVHDRPTERSVEGLRENVQVPVLEADDVESPVAGDVPDLDLCLVRVGRSS